MVMPMTINLVSQIITLMAQCYKLGVLDAYKVENESLCADFIEQTQQPNVFGRVIDGYTIGWQEWCLRLTIEARRKAMYGAMYRYFNTMGGYGSNYYSVILPIAQDFYNRGMTDYNNYPDVNDIYEFESKKARFLWTKKGLREAKWRELVEMIQSMAFSRARIDKAALLRKDRGIVRRYALSENYYLIFNRVMSIVTYRRCDYVPDRYKYENFQRTISCKHKIEKETYADDEVFADDLVDDDEEFEENDD